MSFNLMAAMSTLLCIVIAVFWIRGFWISDSLDWTNVNFSDWGTGTIYMARSEHGKIVFGSVNIVNGTPLLAPKKPWKFQYEREKSFEISMASIGCTPLECWEHFGFGFGRCTSYISPWPNGITVGAILFPDWFAAGISCVLPVWWIMRWRKHRHKLAGKCICCGYDLRATPDRCPE